MLERRTKGTGIVLRQNRRTCAAPDWGRFDRTFGELSRAAHRPGPELAEGRPHGLVGSGRLLPALPQLVSYVFGGQLTHGRVKMACRLLELYKLDT
jgi:hypothetical protein